MVSRRSVAGPVIDPVAARYLRCITQGIQAGTGVPDGDGRLAVVINKQFSTVLKPVGGEIKFILGFNQYGFVSLCRGTSDSTFQTGYVADAAGALTSTTPVKGLINNNLYGGVSSFGQLHVPSRLVNARHNMRYVGPPLTAAGTVKVLDIADEKGVPLDITNASVMRTYLATNWHEPTALPVSAYVDKASRDLHILMLPRDASYSEMIGTFQPGGQSDNSFGIMYPSTTTASNRYIGYGNHPSVRTRLVHYSGLSDDAAVCINSSVCAQFIIPANDSLIPFAKPSEAGSQSWLSNFLAQVNTKPLVDASYDVLTRTAIRAANAATSLAAGAIRQGMLGDL